MKAIAQIPTKQSSEFSSLAEIEIPRPVPAGRDLLVRVNAISVNPVDTKIRRGRGGEETSPRILGWDAAGAIEAMGDAVTQFKTVAALIEAGKLHTTLTETLSPINAENLRAAHAKAESGRAIGKLVLSNWAG